MSHNDRPDAWREQAKFSALRSVISDMDETEAERTYAMVQRKCKGLAGAIRRPEAFRQIVQETDLATLADLHTFLDLLVDEIAEQEALLIQAAKPWVIMFRDMASAEAIKRGLILSKGHNPHDSALATCVALTLGYSPQRSTQ